MKDRADVARFIENQMSWDDDCPRDKVGCLHYGLQELRVLMDYLYDGKPETVDQELKNL